jgi:hypothetical protein
MMLSPGGTFVCEPVVTSEFTFPGPAWMQSLFGLVLKSVLLASELSFAESSWGFFAGLVLFPPANLEVMDFNRAPNPVGALVSVQVFSFGVSFLESEFEK